MCVPLRHLQFTVSTCFRVEVFLAAWSKEDTQKTPKKSSAYVEGGGDLSLRGHQPYSPPYVPSRLMMVFRPFLLVRSCFNGRLTVSERASRMCRCIASGASAAQPRHANNGRTTENFKLKLGRSSESCQNATPKGIPKKGVHIVLPCLAITH